MISKFFSSVWSLIPSWNKKTAVEDLDRNKRRRNFDDVFIPEKRLKLSDSSNFNRSLQKELNYRLKNQPLETIDLTSFDSRFDQKEPKAEEKRSKFLSNIRSSKENFLHRTYCAENKFKTPKHIRSPAKLKNRSRLVNSHILANIDLTDTERTFTRVPLSLILKRKDKMENETKSRVEQSLSPTLNGELSKNTSMNGILRPAITRDEYSLLLKHYTSETSTKDWAASSLVKEFHSLTVDKALESKKKVSPVNSLQSDFESDLRRIERLTTVANKSNSLSETFLRRKKQLLTQCLSFGARRFSSLQDLNATGYSNKLTLNDIVLDDPKEAILPELTPEMLERVKNAFYPYPPDEVLVDKFNYKITRNFMQVLTGTTWLNDEVINFYMEMINDRSKTKSNYPRVHCFNTFFYAQKKNRGYASVRRWTKKIDIFEKELIIVPIHLDIHWALAMINLKTRTITFYDSMGSANHTVLYHLKDYIIEEHKDKKQRPLDPGEWTLINKEKNSSAAKERKRLRRLCYHVRRIPFSESLLLLLTKRHALLPEENVL